MGERRAARPQEEEKRGGDRKGGRSEDLSDSPSDMRLATEPTARVVRRRRAGTPEHLPTFRSSCPPLSLPWRRGGLAALPCISLRALPVATGQPVPKVAAPTARSRYLVGVRPRARTRIALTRSAAAT